MPSLQGQKFSPITRLFLRVGINQLWNLAPFIWQELGNLSMVNLRRKCKYTMQEFKGRYAFQRIPALVIFNFHRFLPRIVCSWASHSRRNGSDAPTCLRWLTAHTCPIHFSIFIYVIAFAIRSAYAFTTSKSEHEYNILAPALSSISFNTQPFFVGIKSTPI